MKRTILLATALFLLLLISCSSIDLGAKKVPYEVFSGYRSKYESQMSSVKYDFYHFNKKIIILDFPCGHIITDNATIDPNVCASDVADVLAEELSLLGLTTERFSPYVQTDINNPIPLSNKDSDCIIIAGEVNRILFNYYDQYGGLAISSTARAYTSNCIVEISVYGFKPSLNQLLFNINIEGFYKSSSEHLQDVPKLHIDSIYSRDTILKAARVAIENDLLRNDKFITGIKEAIQ